MDCRQKSQCLVVRKAKNQAFALARASKIDNNVQAYVILNSYFAVRWALGKYIKINIFTDCQSSIEALRSFISRSESVIKAKENFKLSGCQIGLAWMKAHAGNPGNELTDHHAKLAQIGGVEKHLSAPYSCVKYRIAKS
ncbi:hypothetical protein AVEN_270171-1 [Araneus ventricosus]|uniref:RNase H type-1 domain-containing protein n=1 Tax=Araneus ventricosus TaxID=182803 RepID=A0A4Y2JNB8_ARAVE|nr:hypothetical protein AVEN_270171-1 [Araneus ventricosus]